MPGMCRILVAMALRHTACAHAYSRVSTFECRSLSIRELQDGLWSLSNIEPRNQLSDEDFER